MNGNPSSKPPSSPPSDPPSNPPSRPPSFPPSNPPSGPPASWTFLTNHAHVLLCIAADPEIRLRDVAERVGITERAVQRIVAELEEGGYLQREREGRRNRYEVSRNLPLRHPIERHRSVASLIALVEEDESGGPKRKRG